MEIKVPNFINRLPSKKLLHHLTIFYLFIFNFPGGNSVNFPSHYSLNPNQSNFHWFLSEKIFFTLKSVNFHWFNSEKNIFHCQISQFSLSNQSIFTEIISEIWLIYSNLFLAIWIRQISLLISRFWLIQIYRVNPELF